MMKRTMQIERTLTCDVLVVGAGGAGMRCAAEILEKKPNTGIIALTKVAHPQKSHTSTAQGGLAAVDPADPDDDPLFHMFDTWKGSDCTADQNVVRSICEGAWEEILWLENRGMHFSRDQQGRLSKRTFGGHTRDFGKASAYRAVFEADRTGKGIMDTAWGESLKRGITFIHQCVVVELLLKGRTCGGCVIFEQKTGIFVQINARATVLSSGGCGQVFQVTTNCRQNTGDGLALILEAGLPVMDPEAVQFHPTGIVGPGILASETLRSVGGVLRNRDEEAFMLKYAPKMKELAPRDLVARAIESEIRQGRGVMNPDHQIEHVWIDLRHLPDEVHDNQIPEVNTFFKRYVNLDPRSQLCPVRPSNHYHMGGIPTDESGQVQNARQQRVEGLYAVGECAAASFHGFNRLGTNSILELITMGKRAAGQIIKKLHVDKGALIEMQPVRFSERFAAYFNTSGQDNIARIRTVMRRTMTEKAGVFRTEKGLREAVEILHELKDRVRKTAMGSQGLTMNQELVQRWEIDNLLAVAMTITQAALHRQESRGAHFRDDFPERKDTFTYHTLVRMGDFGDMKLGKRAVDMSIFEAGGPHYKQFGIIERHY